MSHPASSKKVLFIPVDHFGHINPCLGIGEQLVAQGHRAIIALEQSWKGKIPSSYPGIEEALYVDPTRGASSGKANEHWQKNLQSRSDTFRMDAFEKLKSMNTAIAPQRWYILLNVDQELKRIIGQLKPDVIVMDYFTTIPAVYHSGIPWVRLFSGAPLSFLPSDLLPPAGTGFPTNGDRQIWSEYNQLKKSISNDAVNALHEKMEKEFNVPKPTCCDEETGHLSPFLNIYSYPIELDYLDIRPLPETFQRYDHFIRLSEKDPTFVLPDEWLKEGKGKLIYVSMGSMGSVCVDLMQRLIDTLSQSPHRFIFSLGPFHEQLKLSGNMWGAKTVPQVDVLPLVDLVITHGGNNTVLESLYFGKPMLVTPLFADQPENAQRIAEVGLGHRVNPFTCQPEEMLTKIEDLLENEQLKDKLRVISSRMKNSQSTTKAAQAILNVLS